VSQLNQSQPLETRPGSPGARAHKADADQFLSQLSTPKKPTLADRAVLDPAPNFRAGRSEILIVFFGTLVDVEGSQQVCALPFVEL
jgi:hypothetical protein